MSAYSEWKYGLISDSEYNSICRREEAEDRYYQEHGYYEDEVDVDEYDIYLD